MADSKITALAALTAADPANDMVPIVDVSDTSMAASGTTKRISINNILACSPSATLASLNVTGSSIPANGLYLPTTNTLEFSANSLAQYRIAPLGVFSWYDGAGGTRMTLNSTGLGVGMSPQYKLQVGSTTYSSIGLNIASVTDTACIFKGTPDAVGYEFAKVFSGRDTSAYTYGSYLAFYTEGKNSGTTDTSIERLRIDSSGNVGIGVTPSAWGSNNKAVQVGQLGSMYGRANLGYYGTKFNLYDDNTNNIAISTNFVGEYRFEVLNGNHVWLNKSTAGSIGVAQTLTQAMTLDASGNLLVGTTNSTVASAVGSRFIDGGKRLDICRDASTDASIGLDVYSTTAAAYRFYIGLGGTVFATNTTISAISDARLKENVQDIDVGLAAILSLKPRKFDWKAGKGKDIKGDRGFIAQEFETVFPNLVDEWKDPAPEGEAPYKSVRQDLIPVLVKAIQELTARVQTLEAK